MKKVLVVAAHPDDEILGCGATIAKHIEQGHEVKVLIVATGASSRIEDEREAQKNIKELEIEAKKANKAVGVSEENIIFGNFKDQMLETYPRLELNKYLKNLVNEFKPDIIYTHHEGDYNLDHKVLFEAVLYASRPYLGEWVPSEVYSFEILSSTEWGWQAKDVFKPVVFEVLEKKHLEMKLQAMKEYKSEIHEAPHPRSAEAIDTLAKKRGYEVSKIYAEAFELIRSIRG